jgi:RNA polymerase sigma-70 factor (ECF subfamily)
MVFTTAVRLLGKENEAEDISQEVFLRAYQRFDELSRSSTVGGWLKTVTRNLCLNHLSRYRSRWRFFSEFFQAGEEEEENFDVPADETVTRDMEAAEDREMLEEALQKLPDPHRVPLVLYHFEDMSYEEIAAKLGVSLSKVKTDIFRAREALRNRLRWKLEEIDSSTGPAASQPSRERAPRKLPRLPGTGHPMLAANFN